MNVLDLFLTYKNDVDIFIREILYLQFSKWSGANVHRRRRVYIQTSIQSSPNFTLLIFTLLFNTHYLIIIQIQ